MMTRRKPRTHLDQYSRKYKIRKRLATMVYMDSGFKKITSIYNRLVPLLEKASIPEWMTKRKTNLIQKDP